MTTAPDRDAIDAYLDDLLGRLVVSRDRVRRIVVECEDHLREAAAGHERAGLDAAAAQRAAIAEFGGAQQVARRFAAEEGRLLPPSLLLNLVIAGGTLAAVGFVAIGLSGALAALLGALFGKSFVAGDINGITYTAARCADFMRFFPRAASCEAAATAHHFDEVVFYRLDAGALGLIGLAAALVVRRRYPRLSGVRLIPPVVVPTVGAVLFGLAAAGLLTLSLGKLTLGGTTGAGSYLAAGLVSLPMFAWYATRFMRSLRVA